LTAIFWLTWLRSLSASWRKVNWLRWPGLRFADRGHRPALLLARGGDPALQVDDLAPRVSSSVCGTIFLAASGSSIAHLRWASTRLRAGC
jgi:hypothetical protein